ncbi:hypothetical protein NQ317_006384 [Molorchus minor]|uniref:Monocarboxylate transporter n=1 Tax=Molorchus minor TaxID=1323400 RepID=A0ABQ9ITA4_9CUCU|nr:hypothetical protein NQ317_006384 [Molorchus minor]
MKEIDNKRQINFYKQNDKIFLFLQRGWVLSVYAFRFFTSPIIVAICRRKSTRLAAFLGGLILSLACLFTSFAVQFHQALLSYGLVLGVGAGVVRETSTIVLGHYFKRRREFVEMIAQTGTGVGMALFSVLYKEAIGKLGWRLGLQATTGLLALAFFLPIVYRSANLYHPQRRAITHLKNQRKKMKEKKTHTRYPKPPMFDFSPLKSRGLRVITMACAFAALGIYAPIFYLIYQGSREGLEDSGLVVLQTFMGFASALGCVGFGLVIVKPSTQCLISRQYLCQAAMVGIDSANLHIPSGFKCCSGLPWICPLRMAIWNMFRWITYSLKMFTLERIRGRHFTKAWSFIQGAKSIPVLLGIPITGYINQTYPKAGYYFSFVTTIIGKNMFICASLMFLVGTRKDHNSVISTPTTNCNLNNCAIANLNLNDCVCPLGPYNPIFTSDLHSYPFYRTGSNHYERIFTNYNDHFDKSNLRHSYMHKLEPIHHYLPKSMSYAANMDHPMYHYYQQRPASHQDYVRYTLPRKNRPVLRPSKSVPEGLARWQYCPSYRRPVRNIQVVEQITTSV